MSRKVLKQIDREMMVRIVLLLIAIAAGVVWGVFQWAECKHVGHTAFYCIGHVFG